MQQRDRPSGPELLHKADLGSEFAHHRHMMRGRCRPSVINKREGHSASHGVARAIAQ